MSIVHTRMLSQVVDFLPSLCTIQTVTSTMDDHGHGTKVGTNVVGLIGIHCQMKPIKASEVRTSDLVVSANAFRVALLTYAPTITNLMWAIVDGVTYNILGVEHDSQHAMTYLTVELVTT